MIYNQDVKAKDRTKAKKKVKKVTSGKGGDRYPQSVTLKWLRNLPPYSSLASDANPKTLQGYRYRVILLHPYQIGIFFFGLPPIVSMGPPRIHIHLMNISINT